MKSFIFLLFPLLFTDIIDAKETECEKKYGNNNDAVGKFYGQFLPNAKHPITYCNHSITSYLNVANQFKNFTDDKNCSSKYLDLDRMNIVRVVHEQIMDLWTKAHCDDCFDWTTVNANKTVPDVDKEFTSFKNLSDTYNACYTKYIHIAPENICKECEKNYLELQNFFEGMQKLKHHKICFDIQDAMNVTRRQWSGELNCCKDKNSSLTFFITIASVVGIGVPIVFYMSFYFYKMYKNRTGYLEIDSRTTQMPQPGNSAQNNLSAPIQNTINQAADESNLNIPDEKPTYGEIVKNIDIEDAEEEEDDDPILSSSVPKTNVARNTENLLDF